MEPVTSCGSDIAEFVIMLDGYSSNIIRDALSCLDDGLGAAQKSAIQNSSHSEAEVMDFLLGSEDGRNWTKDSFPLSRGENTALSFFPLDSDSKGEAVDIVVKIEPESVTQPAPSELSPVEMNSTVNGSSKAKTKVRKKHVITPAMLARTCATIETNIWGKPDAEYKPESELKKDKHLRRSKRESVAKAKAIKAVKAKGIPVDVLVANWKERQQEKVKKREAAKSKFRCQPCDKGFIRLEFE
jgi:hypothetical protein